MTVLEFISHLNRCNWVSVQNIDSQNSIHCKAYELESEVHEYWHDLEVCDWYMNDFGKVFLEVRNV